MVARLRFGCQIESSCAWVVTACALSLHFLGFFRLAAAEEAPKLLQTSHRWQIAQEALGLRTPLSLLLQTDLSRCPMRRQKLPSLLGESLLAKVYAYHSDAW